MTDKFIKNMFTFLWKPPPLISQVIASASTQT